ncbi:MAG: PEP-CTERM sorting domain-containing protein [Opitutus sp.]|nr:PEP-CTERM sorting domain-containing protein [Opitutus sp.]
MFPRHRTLLWIAAFGLAMGSASAAVVVHEFALRGTLDDNKGGPALASLGGQITALGYVFTANQGLTLSSTALSSTDFSLELSFKFDAISGYRKIADFHDRADDTGFYQLSGSLNFYPIVTASTADFVADTNVHVVLTRDGATSVVTGFVNGQQRFSFVDTSPLATITAAGNKLTLFADDFSTSQREASSGTVNYVRVFNGALTAAEVNALFLGGSPSAVPEPSTLVLLGAGVLIVGCTTRRKRLKPRQ